MFLVPPPGRPGLSFVPDCAIRILNAGLEWQRRTGKSHSDCLRFKDMAMTRETRNMLIGEVLGTYLITLIGTGVVATAVLTGAQVGLGQVAAVWWAGVTIAIFVSRPLGVAHLNPAVTISMATLGKFQWNLVASTILAQLAGAVLAGVTVAVAFGSLLDRFLASKGLTIGAPGSQVGAMVFGEYFPNPAMFGTGPDAYAVISPVGATIVEAFGTAILVFAIIRLTDPRSRVPDWLAPILIGLVVATLINLFAPLTQAAWNPARDLGPRLVAWAIGFGDVAIPGPRGEVFVYIVGPVFGGIAGGLAAKALEAISARQGKEESQ